MTTTENTVPQGTREDALAKAIAEAEAFVRQEADEQFNWVAANPRMVGRTLEGAVREAELGLALVELALGMQVGEVLNFNAWLDQNAPSDQEKTYARACMPFMEGALQLLAREFVHPGTGVLPVDLVTLVLSGEPHMYEGVSLRAEAVAVQYRRLALVDPEALQLAEESTSSD